MNAKLFLLLLISFITIPSLFSQNLISMGDTSKEAGIGGGKVLANRFDNIKLTEYIQPQFQIASSKGAKGFSGGDFATNSNSRFMLRRARVRFEYNHLPKTVTGTSMQMAFLFDCTERGVGVLEVQGTVFENKYQLFSFTTGLFLLPFSYEVNYYSSDRESPERGRMSQILSRSESDLGAMVTIESRKKNTRFKFIKANVGIFNGPGLSATTDFDSHKDILGRVSLKPQPIGKKGVLAASMSMWYGGLSQNTHYVYQTHALGGIPNFTVDSSVDNLGKTAPRKYYSADAQFTIKNKIGATVFRVEYSFGKQTASESSTETPAILFTGHEGYYIRNFNGAFLYFLQNLGSLRHQIAIKYDWYDPNTDVKGGDIGKSGNNLNASNIKYSTVGFGYINHITDNIKLLLWYDKVTNEKTQLSGFTEDVLDNVFTCRVQFRF